MFNWKERFLNLMCLDNEGGAGGGSGTGSGEGEGDKGNNNSSEKTFTQEELNNILASEKRKNISNVYKDLGFEKPEDAKAFIEKYKDEEEKKKDDLTKAQDRVAELEKEKATEAKKAREAEYKFKAIEEGCDAKNATDVVALAISKMTDDKDFDAALKEVKESYPIMFESSNNDNNPGTGSSANNPRRKSTGKELEGIGKRLAEQRKNNAKSKVNEFFKS